MPPFPKITDAPHFQGFGNMVDILKNIFYIFRLDVNFIQIEPLKTILWTKNSSLVKQIPDGHHFYKLFCIFGFFSNNNLIVDVYSNQIYYI